MNMPLLVNSHKLKEQLIEALKLSLERLKGQTIDDNTWMLIDEDIRKVIDNIL